MNGEDELKEHLRRLAEEKSFPFEEEEWDRAAAYIRSRRAGSRIRWGIAAVLLLTGVSALLMLQSGEQATVSAPSVASRQHAMPVVKGRPGQEKTVHTKEQSTSSVHGKDHVKAPTKNGITQKAALNVPPPSPAGMASSARPESNTGVVIPPVAKRSPPEASALAPNSAVSPTSEISGRAAASSTADVAHATPVVSPESRTAADEPAGKPRELAAKEAVEKPDVTQPAADGVTNEPVQAADTAVVSDVPAAGSPNPLMPAPDSTTSHIDTAARLLDGIVATRFMRWSVEGGGTWLRGWNNDAQGLNPVLGINWYRPVYGSIFVSLGVQYNAIGHLHGYSHTSRSIRYGTGEESRVTVITPNTLHYLVVPVRVYLGVGANDAIGAGVNIARLMNVTGTMETYTYRLNHKEDVRQLRASGYMQGFNPYEVQLSLFYRRKIWKDIYAQGEVFAGLTDVRDNTFFSSDAMERNSGIKVTLLYRLPLQ